MYANTDIRNQTHSRPTKIQSPQNAKMCQYSAVLYTCNHRHHILEISPLCYLVDADGNCSGCCEKENHDTLLRANSTRDTYQSDFRCPGCCRPKAAEMVGMPLDVILGAASRKAKEAVERGMVWAKFRTGEKKGGGGGGRRCRWLRSIGTFWRFRGFVFWSAGCEFDFGYLCSHT